MIGVKMRAGLFITGLVMIVFGLLMVMTLWPLTGFDTKDSFNISDVKKGERTTYIGEITAITESGEWYVIELDEGVIDYYTKEKLFASGDNVVIVIEFGGNASNWDENEYISIEKTPTFGGLFGLSLVILGLIINIVGFLVKKRNLVDYIFFESQPSIKPQQTNQNLPSEIKLHDPQIDTAKTKIPQLEQITCPKCSNTFSVEVLMRPLKISCPHCGQKGILD